MLLERNQALVGIVVAVLLVVGTVFAVGATGGLFVPGERYNAEFTDSAGLEPGSFVFMAGVRVGQVTDVQLLDDRVLVEFSSTGPAPAADASVDVIISNALGKRALRINPGSSDTTIAAGDVVPLERTDTPVDLPELGDRSAELLGELDVQALQDVTTALADATDGNRDQVVDLLVGLEDVSQVLIDRREDLRTLLVETEDVVDAVDDADTDLIRVIDAFGSTLDRLADRRQDVVRLLDETSAVTQVSGDLLVDRDAQLDRILDDLHTDLQVIEEHQVDLAAVLPALAQGLEGFSSIGYAGLDRRDNPGWGNVFASGVGFVGVNPLLDCGGVLDDLFTQLVGPDPRCGDDDDGAQVLQPDQTLEEVVEGILQQNPLDGAGEASEVPLVETAPVRSMDRFLSVPGDLLGGGR